MKKTAGCRDDINPASLLFVCSGQSCHVLLRTGIAYNGGEKNKKSIVLQHKNKRKNCIFIIMEGFADYVTIGMSRRKMLKNAELKREGGQGKKNIKYS